MGGGIVGLAAVVALRFVGGQVDVYEQATLLGEVGAGVALAPDSLRVVRRLGLAEEVSRRAAALDVVGIRRPAGHAVGSRCWATRRTPCSRTWAGSHQAIEDGMALAILIRDVDAADGVKSRHSRVDLVFQLLL